MDKDKKQFIAKIVRIIAISLLLFAIFKGIFVLIILISLSLGTSFFVNRFQLRNFGIEFVTLIAVLTGIKYGPFVSLPITFVLILYHLAAGGFFGPYWFWVIPSYCLGGMMASFFPAADISSIGFYVTLGINFVGVFFTGIASPGFLPRYLPFAFTNAVFNLLIFNLFGRVLLLLLI